MYRRGGADTEAGCGHARVGGAALEAVCGLIAAHGTVHYRVTGRPERICVFTLPDEAGASQSLEVPAGDFWDARHAPDLAMRLGWHESAGAGGTASAGFTYAVRCPAGARLVIEDRAWYVPASGRRRRATHGILHVVDAARAADPAPLSDPGAMAVHRALGGGRFDVAFQPVVDAETGRIGFHECLARLAGPDGQLHTAASFMPQIEAAGLAARVDRQVLAHAFGRLAANPAARLSVNIHPRTIADPDWRAIFDEAAAADQSAAERLIVEITEHGAMEDVAATRRFIDHLQSKGTALALDDFGEGQTSFAQLRDFRFDIVKIAGSFVRKVAEDPDARFFVQTLVGVARHFEMMTVAEYVQTAACARILASLGVDCFQGFYYGRPSLVLEPTDDIHPRVAAQ